MNAEILVQDAPMLRFWSKRRNYLLIWWIYSSSCERQCKANQ